MPRGQIAQCEGEDRQYHKTPDQSFPHANSSADQTLCHPQNV
jgi:hypothetical protein